MSDLPLEADNPDLWVHALTVFQRFEFLDQKNADAGNQMPKYVDHQANERGDDEQREFGMKVRWVEAARPERQLNGNDEMKEEGRIRISSISNDEHHEHWDKIEERILPNEPPHSAIDIGGFYIDNERETKAATLSLRVVRSPVRFIALPITNKTDATDRRLLPT